MDKLVIAGILAVFLISVGCLGGNGYNTSTTLTTLTTTTTVSTVSTTMQPTTTTTAGSNNLTVQNSSQGYLAVTSDKPAYSWGDTITFTATNTGNQNIAYSTCNGTTPMFLITNYGQSDYDYNTISSSNCNFSDLQHFRNTFANLTPGQSLAATFKTDPSGPYETLKGYLFANGFYSLSGSTPQQPDTVNETTAPILFNAAQISVKITADKPTYHWGDNVTLNVVNDGQTPINYYVCNGAPRIQISQATAWATNNTDTWQNLNDSNHPYPFPGGSGYYYEIGFSNWPVDDQLACDESNATLSQGQSISTTWTSSNTGLFGQLPDGTYEAYFESPQFSNPYSEEQAVFNLTK